ncbi:MAG TPA: hypothetical protein VIL49_10025, partial [Capillimicrobium sp.]
GAQAGLPTFALPLQEARARARKAPAGAPTVLLRAEAPPGGPPVNRWFALRDRPALTGADIVAPEVDHDDGPGGTGEPIVVFGFTDEARQRWQTVTRAISERGQRAHVPGQDPLQAAHHFAMALDEQILSVPYIDFAENPDGIDGVNGSQVQGGFTVESARELVALLDTGELPAPVRIVDREP